MTHPIRKVFQAMPAPRPVKAHLVYFPPGSGDSPDTPEYWTVRLYRDDFDSNSAADRLVIFNWVSDIIAHMRKIDENVYVEVYERAPR